MRIVAICLLLSGCTERVYDNDIAACATACATSKGRLLRVTGTECVCDYPERADGGTR